ncbi:uncharacterized protein LOC142541722 [Primulina tabacum]|uniref:uncharacterized protein LOC142541722 n=1 Tax=Primulina tabacum TaxID=48773 RepID=UPI003F59ECE6
MAQARNNEMSRIWRCSERTKLVPNSPSLSTGFRSKTGYDKEPIIMDYNDAKEAPNSLQETRDIFFSAAQFRPSGIRPPSPKFGFFDEKTPLISLGEPKTRSNTPRKVEMLGTPFDAKAHEFRCSRTDTLASSTCEKLKRNTKKLKAAHVNPRNATNIKETCSIKKTSEDASRKLSKYDPFLSQENGKKKSCTDSRDRHGKLCRYFEAIDLKQDNRQQSSLSSNKNRTPLTEKAPSINCDYSNTNLIWFETK